MENVQNLFYVLSKLCMGPELNLLYWPSEFHPLRAYPLMTQPESALCRARPPVLKHRDNRNHFPKNLFNLLKKKSKSHLTFNGHKIVFQPINFTKMLPICVSSIQIQNHSKSNFLHHQNFSKLFSFAENLTSLNKFSHRIQEPITHCLNVLGNWFFTDGRIVLMPINLSVVTWKRWFLLTLIISEWKRFSFPLC